MSWQYGGPSLARPASGEMVTLASDGDRDAAGGVMNEAFAVGRLTADEHGERVRAAYAARTLQELARLTADLPDPGDVAGQVVAGVPDGADRCLLCALLICCPPAGIAWLLVSRHRSRAGQQRVRTAAGGPAASGRGGAAVRAGNGWRAEDC